MIDIFDEIGSRVADRWRQHDFDNLALPDIACRVLSDLQPHTTVSSTDIATSLIAARTMPTQPNIDSAFGQPPVTVFSHPRFFIEVLHWTLGTTLIHQHGFSGAFCLLSGTSLQSTYSFLCTRRVNVHMLLGDLNLNDVTVLTPGDVNPIRSGTALIHSVFHLDFPSLTLVVRTHTDVDSKPQYNYAPPHVAIDPYFSNPFLHRQVQCLEFLHRIGSDQFETSASIAVSESDLYDTYMLMRAMGNLCDNAVMTRLLAIAQDRHGDQALSLWGSIQEERRQKILLRARDRIRHSEGRFLLALLMNVRSRARILDLIGSRYPSRNPQSLLLEWCYGLTKEDVGVEFDDVNRLLFGGLVEGYSVDDAVEQLHGVIEVADIEAMRGDLVTQCHVLVTTPYSPTCLPSRDRGTDMHHGGPITPAMRGTRCRHSALAPRASRHACVSHRLWPDLRTRGERSRSTDGRSARSRRGARH